jgi:hypothetical protein
LIATLIAVSLVSRLISALRMVGSLRFRALIGGRSSFEKRRGGGEVLQSPQWLAKGRPSRRRA